jgi:hypothetical protein
MTPDQLIDELARPTFVLRMARALENNRLAPHTKPAMVKSARTRAAQARIDIDLIVERYITQKRQAHGSAS